VILKIPKMISPDNYPNCYSYFSCILFEHFLTVCADSSSCSAIYDRLQLGGESSDASASTSRLLKRFVAPFISGKVIYTPKNAATDAIIANVSTIQDLVYFAEIRG